MLEKAATIIHGDVDHGDGAPGPSKRQRVGPGVSARYHTLPSTASQTVNGKGKENRKRAFSPSAPMMSSDEEGEGGDGADSDEDAQGGKAQEQEAEDADLEGITPYGSPGPWRAR